jgi:hypothetical protein
MNIIVLDPLQTMRLKNDGITRSSTKVAIQNTSITIVFNTTLGIDAKIATTSLLASSNHHLIIQKMVVICGLLKVRCKYTCCAIACFFLQLQVFGWCFFRKFQHLRNLYLKNSRESKGI